jgi:TatD DNase family protein
MFTEESKVYWDAHIHLEKYEDSEIERFLSDARLEGVIAVSMDLPSSRRTLQLKKRFPGKVFAACGFHPEQPPCFDRDQWYSFLNAHREEIDAIGEAGLPYYLERERKKEGKPFDKPAYLHILQTLLKWADEWDKPVILHGVHEDVPLICDLLEETSIRRVHFHWLKTDPETLKRMEKSGYYVSFTPDLLYNEKTRQVARSYPLERIMAETDGPWPFEHPFAGKRTEPPMVWAVLKELARLKGLPFEKVAGQVRENTRRFLRIS